MTPVRFHASLGPPSRVLVIKISQVDVPWTCHGPASARFSHFHVCPRKVDIAIFLSPPDMRENKVVAHTHSFCLFTVNEGQPWLHLPICPGDTGFLGWRNKTRERTLEAPCAVELNQGHSVRGK